MPWLYWYNVKLCVLRPINNTHFLSFNSTDFIYSCPVKSKSMWVEILRYIWSSLAMPKRCLHLRYILTKFTAGPNHAINPIIIIYNYIVDELHHFDMVDVLMVTYSMTFAYHMWWVNIFNMAGYAFQTKQLPPVKLCTDVQKMNYFKNRNGTYNYRKTRVRSLVSSPKRRKNVINCLRPKITHRKLEKRYWKFSSRTFGYAPLSNTTIYKTELMLQRNYNNNMSTSQLPVARSHAGPSNYKP